MNGTSLSYLPNLPYFSRLTRLVCALLFIVPTASKAEWTNSYPLIDNFGHHVYLEGFEIPILNAGMTDPAPSPDGKQLAFASRGWLWVLDLGTQSARRVTQSAEVDARPNWSQDSSKLVFVRVADTSLSIVMLNLETKQETVLINSEGIHLDPSFSNNDTSVVYSSTKSGPMGIWEYDLNSQISQPLIEQGETGRRVVLRKPTLSADGSALVYLNKQNSKDSISVFNIQSKTSKDVVTDSISAQADFAISPNAKYMAYVWPYDGGWELRLLALAAPHTSVLLTQSKGMPLSPAFSADGEHVYYAEANDSDIMELYRMPIVGGSPELIRVNNMDWGVATGTLRLTSKVDSNVAPVRLNIVDESGHPIAPQNGAVRKEMEHSRVFFYSPGVIEVLAPVGKVVVSAVQGFETPESQQSFEIKKDAITEGTIELTRAWDASKLGWYSADTHFHLNYGGPYRLAPEDIIPDIQAEGIDVAVPLIANLHNRFLEQSLWGWENPQEPIIYFGQEVRSHFLGHIGIFGTKEIFWPWIWGPYYEIYKDDDRSNAEPLDFARSQGGLGGYVHPVAIQNPLTPDTFSSIPIGLVADAVLGKTDVIELACLWTDEIGTASVWHQILNIGVQLAATAGSDVMNNYYHTMPIGSTRVYVKPQSGLSKASFESALKAGKSVVSNGPMLEFTIDDIGPGEVINNSASAQTFKLNVHSVSALDSIEIFVNGKVIKTIAAQDVTNASYSGELLLPEGGWVSARVLGENTQWPTQDSYLYAETSPIWINAVGSTDPLAQQASAETLLMVLEHARTNLKQGYGEADIPKLEAHFAEAKARLEALAR